VIIPGSHKNSETVLKLKPIKGPSAKSSKKLKKTTVPIINLNPAEDEEESDN
jgi:hypothetical protein